MWVGEEENIMTAQIPLPYSGQEATVAVKLEAFEDVISCASPSTESRNAGCHTDFDKILGKTSAEWRRG